MPPLLSLPMLGLSCDVIKMNDIIISLALTHFISAFLMNTHHTHTHTHLSINWLDGAMKTENYNCRVEIHFDYCFSILFSAGFLLSIHLILPECLSSTAVKPSNHNSRRVAASGLTEQKQWPVCWAGLCCTRASTWFIALHARIKQEWPRRMVCFEWTIEMHSHSDIVAITGTQNEPAWRERESLEVIINKNSN